MKTPRFFLKMYKKSSDLPERACELRIAVKDLQTLFAEPPSNPMYDCYPVSDSQKAALEALTGEKILLSAYDYFVECEA